MTEEVVETKTITLKKPIEFGGQKIAVLELREPTMGEFKRARDSAKGDEFDTGLALLAIVTGVPPGAIDLIGLQQITEASDFLAGFTSAALPIGS